MAATRDELVELSKAQLLKLAADNNVADAEKLPNKGAIADAILAASPDVDVSSVTDSDDAADDDSSSDESKKVRFIMNGRYVDPDGNDLGAAE